MAVLRQVASTGRLAGTCRKAWITVGPPSTRVERHTFRRIYGILCRALEASCPPDFSHGFPSRRIAEIKEIKPAHPACPLSDRSLGALSTAELASISIASSANHWRRSCWRVHVWKLQKPFPNDHRSALTPCCHIARRSSCRPCRFLRILESEVQDCGGVCE